MKKFKMDNYRLMKDCDALISDYSSAGTDFLHLNRPVAYSIDDMKQYKIGFVSNDPTEYMGGHLLENVDDFMQFVDDVINENDIYQEKRKECFNKIFKYHDGNSCKRIAELLGIDYE